MKTCGLRHIQGNEFCDKHLTTRMVRHAGMSFLQSRLGAVAAGVVQDTTGLLESNQQVLPARPWSARWFAGSSVTGL
jgi:hypothetical protein